MPPKPTLDGARLKIERAKKHFIDLQSAIIAYETAYNQSAGVKAQPKGKGFSFSVEEVPEIDPFIPLMLGDFVHNLRSTLDHIVCQLALLNGQPVECCTKTAFPVCIDPSHESLVRKAKRFVSSKAFEVIEECQPYAAAKAQGYPPEHHTLWILSELDNIDKHRTVLVVAKKIRPIGFEATLGDKTVKLPAPSPMPWQTLEKGAELAQVNLHPVGNIPDGAEMHVQLHSEIAIQFAKTGLACDGEEIKVPLAGCIRLVEDIVRKFDDELFE